MTFNVNYDLTSGAIVSYQGGGDGSENDAPDGCGTLTFADVFPQMFDSNGNVVMKVDVKAKQLVFINPVVIPQPI
jgi:hypothetical protein